MSLTTNEVLAELAVIGAFFVFGYIVGRPLAALVPFLGLVVFIAVTYSSNDVYSRIPEDVQATIVFALFGGTALALAGALFAQGLVSRSARPDR